MSTCIISFSSRTGGNCAGIGKLISSLVESPMLYDFSEFEIHPCGNCRYECFALGENCPYIQDMEYTLLDAVTNSDLTYFIMPNYSDYPCANFFIFNERSQCYFQGRADLLNVYESVFKRVIVVSNTNEENFRKAISYHSKAEPEILFFSARKYGKSSIKDDLLTSEKSTCRYYSFVQRSILMSVTN